MPVDAQIPLSVQTPQPANPLETFGRIEALKSAMQGQQVQQAQLTGINQENQMRGIQMDQMQKINSLYRDALSPDGSIDSQKLSTAMAANGVGARIPEVLKGVTDYQQSVATLGKTRLEVQNLQADAAGSLGRTLQAANYDPQLFLTKMQAGLSTKAFTPQEAGPQIQAVQQALMQDPTGGTARGIVQKFADNAVQGSEKWAAIKVQEQNAQGNANRGKAQMGEFDLNTQKFQASETSRLLGTAADQHAWDNARIALGRQGVDISNIPTTFSPQLAQQYANQGKTPGQITSEADLKDFRQSMLDLNRQRIAQGDQRIVISQQNADTNAAREQRGPQSANPYSPVEIDKQRKLLDAVHTQRNALGSALAVPNGEQYVDPKTGKISPNDMDDQIRAGLQKQMETVTNQGRGIISKYAAQSGGRILPNELPGQGSGAAPLQGQQGGQGSGNKPAGNQPAKNTAPEGTIITNPTTRQRLQKVNGQWKPI